MEKYCISVDWLQVCCYGNLLEDKDYRGKEHTYKVVMSDIHTALFQVVFDIQLNDMSIATVQQLPRSSALKKGLTLIKLSNRVLWSTRYIELLYDLMYALSVTYKGITRIDLCYDCNYYYDGRHPGRFINDYVLLPVDEIGGMYRRGSTKFTVQGGRSSCSSTKLTGIKFGSSQNGVVPYIYDKTLELKEVKDKPWIREVWAENGLISDEKTHVWRSEISIKCEGTDLLNMQSGQLFKLSPSYMEHYENIVKLFHFYAAKVFDFRINTGQKTKRHFKPLQLFDTSIEITCKPMNVSRAADTGRMEKICYNKLERLSREYSDLSEPVRQSLVTAMDFLSHLSGIKLSVTKANRYKHYLDSLYGSHFFEAVDIAYLEALDECRVRKNEVIAEDLRYSVLLYETEEPHLT